MKRWIGRLTGWFLLGIFLSPGVSPLWAARTDPHEKDITQKKKDLKDIKKEITLTREKEKEIRGQESSILESLSQIETKLYQKEKELQQMEPRLSQTNEKLRQTKSQVLLLNKGMERTKEEFLPEWSPSTKWSGSLPKPFSSPLGPFPIC